MMATRGCWAAFGALQADETQRFGYPPIHGLAVDAYAASHGGDGAERRDRQSVCIHLMAICMVRERGITSARRIALLREFTTPKTDWPQLDRPPGVPALSHTHAAGARDLEDYTARVRDWADAVWAFWAPEHARIRALLDERLARRGHGEG